MVCMTAITGLYVSNLISQQVFKCYALVLAIALPVMLCSQCYVKPLPLNASPIASLLPALPAQASTVCAIRSLELHISNSSTHSSRCRIALGYVLKNAFLCLQFIWRTNTYFSTERPLLSSVCFLFSNIFLFSISLPFSQFLFWPLFQTFFNLSKRLRKKLTFFAQKTNDLFANIAYISSKPTII